MTTKSKRWLAVYTKPRWEKKVDLGLADAGLERYCPLNRVKKKWSDRMKWVDEPLFKSYVFVHVTEDEERAVRLVPGVLNFVYWLGKPAVVKQDDIDNIRKFLKEYDQVTVLPLEVTTNSQVVISSGVFMGHKGRVITSTGKMVEVEIESLGAKLVAKFEKQIVEAAGRQSRK